jgi:membrane-associated phospholipid phosphatase
MQRERQTDTAGRSGASTMRTCLVRVVAVLACAWSASAAADFDHRVAVDDSGIWSRTTQNVVRYGAVAATLGGALWLGGDDPLGRTFWKSVDSLVVGQVAAEVAKRGFGRRRPSQTDDPHDWFNHDPCCRSFPSGEVTLQASVVTPFIVDYAAEHPWVWALELLPAYDAIARVKSGAHWQTDVLAGWALGTAVGYWSAKRKEPLFLQVMPHGVAAGIRMQF